MIKLNDLILWILALIPLTVNAAAYSRLPKEINIVFGGETMPTVRSGSKPTDLRGSLWYCAVFLSLRKH